MSKGESMSSKRVGVVFPGHGEQYIGMGKDLYDELRLVQEFFEQAAGTAEINFVKLLFASSDQDILSIRYGYVANYLFETCLYEVLYQKGLRPDFVAGHGIGEYAAAYASRSLSFVDGLYILNKYAQFYDEFLKDKDLTVLRIIREFDVESIEELCEKKSSKKEHAYVSAQNTLNAFYVAGNLKVIEKIQEYCIKEVIRKVRIIGPGYGMHSVLVDDIVEQIKLYYHKIKFNDLQIPLITNVDGVYVTTAAALESAIMRKINNRILWLEVMKGFEGCDVVISVGPGTQLIEWFKEMYPDKEYHQISTMKDFAAIEYLFAKPEEVVVQEVATEEIITEEKPTLFEADAINEQPTDFDVEDDE
jgi:[acyl-carrier-protein] S-malonyltransferase